jgi:outer membrane immunogenic protein
MRNLLVASTAVAAVVLAAPAAFAADLPMYEPAPAYAAPAPASSPWTGGYVGAQAGYSWGHAHNKSGAPKTHPDGPTVGAYAGYNVQFDNSPVVVGVDTDINYDTADAKRNFAGGTARIKNEQTWSGATRGKIGYAMDRVMVYGAGGVAYAGEKVSARVGPASGSDSKTAVGWTAGGGVEALVSENLTARVDYRYNDYGTEKFKVGGGTVKSDLTENRVTAGVAYKFSGF